MLTLIGTPLGNIEDISLRQLRALFETSYIFAEDTRNHLKLKSILNERYSEILKSLNISTETSQQVFSYREQNHAQATSQVIKLLRNGETVGLVTDAGMPTISDPGQRLVEEVLKQGFEVDIIPGATAIETSLSISGLPTDKFTFLGFLPRERGKILKILESRFMNHDSIVVYESPFRVIKTLEFILELSENIQVAACNDLTKKFQKIFRGNIKDVVEQLKREKKIIGEWVIVMNN